ncbi:MAG: universal stress protein [Syntrophobacteraceae bacterium]
MEVTMANTMEGCVMLALSTFRKSEVAVHTAMQNAKRTRKLCVVFVADLNLAGYFIATEIPPAYKEMYEAEILKLDERVGLAHVEEIGAEARREGIEMKAVVKIGRFAVVCLDLVKEEKPSMIVTTRSQRPEWVRRLFGSPVDALIEKAGCPVLVVPPSVGEGAHYLASTKVVEA